MKKFDVKSYRGWFGIALVMIALVNVINLTAAKPEHITQIPPDLNVRGEEVSDAIASLEMVFWGDGIGLRTLLFALYHLHRPSLMLGFIFSDSPEMNFVSHDFLT